MTLTKHGQHLLGVGMWEDAAGSLPNHHSWGIKFYILDLDVHPPWCICIDVDFAIFGTSCDYVRRLHKCIIFVHTADIPCQSYPNDSCPSMSSDEDNNALQVAPPFCTWFFFGQAIILWRNWLVYFYKNAELDTLLDGWSEEKWCYMLSILWWGVWIP